MDNGNTSGNRIKAERQLSALCCGYTVQTSLLMPFRGATQLQVFAAFATPVAQSCHAFTLSTWLVHVLLLLCLPPHPHEGLKL